MMRKEASSFLDHLAELRKRLMRVLAVLVVTGGAGWRSHPGPSVSIAVFTVRWKS